MGDMNAKVWAISEKALFEKGKWTGLKKDNLNYYLRLFKEKGEFLTRGPLESDPSYKQIIGQIVLQVGNEFLLHQITEKTPEKRLKNLWPIFVGGHIEEIDLRVGQDIAIAAADREFEEEILYKGSIIEKKLLGIVYVEDGNSVNHCHIGLVFRYVGDRKDVHSREDVISKVQFMTRDELKQNEDKLSYWSKLVLPEL